MASAVTGSGNSGSSSGGSGRGVGGGNKLVNLYNGVMAEMRKVTWPDRMQVWKATYTIIVFVLLIGLLITLLDFVLQAILIKGIPSLFAGR